MNALITSPIGVMASLIGIAAFFFWLEAKTKWEVFNYLPPLLWIYATPILLSNTGIIPHSNPAYTALREYGLPIFISLMLLKVDVIGAVRIMGKGVLVMLIGSLGVVVGAVVSYTIAVKFAWLSADTWPAFGTLSGSWIGGTGNMNATWAALDGESQHMTMAAVADNLVYIIWLPILLGSKAFADRANRWLRVPEGRVEEMEAAALAMTEKDRPPAMRHLLYLAMIALSITWGSMALAKVLPDVYLPALEFSSWSLPATLMIGNSTWIILLVTTFSLLASATPARRIPASQPIAMAIIYIFVASVGAHANLTESNLSEIGWFVAAAYLWIFIHGIFILFGAWLFKVDVHTLAIASAANIGGAASAPVVAAHHREALVPVSILMALIGYALGNYLAILTGRITQVIGAMLG